MKILYGPPGDSSRTPFFNGFADDPRTASSLLWITPTQRKRQWVQERFRDRRRAFPPRIHLFDEVVRILYEHSGGTARYTSPEAAQAILLRLIGDPAVAPALSQWFDHPPGPGFLMETARQIDEFQRHGIAPETLAAIPDAGDDMGALFHHMYSLYHDYLEANRRIDTGGMGLHVVEELDGGGFDAGPDLPWSCCVMDGFLELTPLQLDILRGLDRRLDLTLIWPGNPAPGGLLHWMSAGLKTAFPDAEWEALAETGGGPAAAAYHLGGYEPEVLPEDIRPDDPETGIRPVDPETGIRPVDPESGIRPVDPESGAQAALRIIERDALRDEVTSIARDIRERHDAGGCRWSDFAVTFPELQSHAPTVRRIFRRYDIPVNISQALPLTGSPVFIAIDRLLRLPSGWHRDDVLAVIGDAVLTGLHPDESRRLTRRLVEWSSRFKIIRGFDGWTAAIERLMEARSPGGETAATAATSLQLFRRFESVLQDDPDGGDTGTGTAGPMTRTIDCWLRWLRTVLGRLDINRNIEKLQRLVISNMESGSEHFEYTRRAYNRLVEFFDAVEPLLAEAGDTGTEDGTIGASEFRALLPRMLAGIDYQLTTRSGDRVQVLGLLGVRGLTFRHVYFGGLTEQVFPRRDVISPFWRADLKTVLLDQPAHHERITAFGDLIRVMSAATDTLTISRPCRDGDEKLLPSPLWDCVKAVFLQHETVRGGEQPLCVRDRLVEETRGWLHAGTGSAPVLVGLAVAGKRRSGSGRWCGDLGDLSDTGDAVRAIIGNLFGASQTFSASNLETWLKCPRMFFFQHLLRLGEPEVPEDEISRMDRGTLVHKALCRFYRERLDNGWGRVRPGEETDCARRIREMAAEEFEAMGYAGEAAMRQYLDIIGRPELEDEGTAGRFARLEAQGSQDLHPALLEWTFGRSPKVPPLELTDPSGVPVLIEGKIDRIDRSADGTDAVIWDYKTGALPANREILEFRSLQIGLYMMAASRILGHSVNAGGYCHLPARNHASWQPVLRLAGSAIDACLPPPGSARQPNRSWEADEFSGYFETLTDTIIQAAGAIRRGLFPVAPGIEPCERCDFVGLCHRTREIEHARD